MKIQPYLMFDGRCDEAIAFYKVALGATLVMRIPFKESPDQTNIRPEMGEKVMHAELRIGDTVFFASDGHCVGTAKFDGFNMNAQVTTEAEAHAVYAKLADGGQPQMPLTKTFFSPAFGMLTDKFGVGWMVYVSV